MQGKPAAGSYHHGCDDGVGHRRADCGRAAQGTVSADKDHRRHVHGGYRLDEKARQSGIESFWFKTYSDISLLEVMDRTMAGESVYPEKAPGVMLGCLQASKLTKQQRSLLRYLTEGLSNREIAEKMYLSPNTVKDYLDDLMEKTGIHSRTALVAQASRLGIVVSETDRKNET